LGEAVCRCVAICSGVRRARASNCDYSERPRPCWRHDHGEETLAEIGRTYNVNGWPNVEIILTELDTFYDFKSYITAKEAAIDRFDNIMYCGEEDLLANYYLNFDNVTGEHFIGVLDKSTNILVINEGEWQDFIKSEPYKRKKQADQSSYLWDHLLQMTTQNALDGTLLGNSDIYNSQSAIFEMAKEPRFMRRELAAAMQQAIDGFPEDGDGIVRNMSFFPSFYNGTGYIFLQIKHPDIVDYNKEYRPKRAKILEIACGVARNKFSHLTKIVGIVIDAPKFSKRNSEDFILLSCTKWSNEDRQFYEEQNRGLRFFETPALKVKIKTARNFPTIEKNTKHRKIGRNELCPCGSGKKYKKCHGFLLD
jgi:SEC-C motif